MAGKKIEVERPRPTPKIERHEEPLSENIRGTRIEKGYDGPIEPSPTRDESRPSKKDDD